MKDMQDNRMNAEKIIHKELSYLVNGCVFDVHNEVGPGLREESYQKAMELRLAEKGIPFIAKPATRGELIYRGQKVDVFEPDLIIANLYLTSFNRSTRQYWTRFVTEFLNCIEFLELATLQQRAEN